MSNIVNQYSSSIVTMYQNVLRTYEENIKLIKRCEEELNDLNHEVELSDNKDMYKGYLMYKEIRDVRRRRRCAKQENELLEGLYDFLKSPAGQNFKTHIQQIQGNTSKIESTQKSRTYVPRQRKDLTIVDKTCTVHEPFEVLMKEFNKTKVTVQGGKMRKS